MAEQGKV